MGLKEISIIAETKQFLLGNIYEQVYLIRKADDLITELGAIYGDAQCGLIDQNGNWCIAAGESVLIWRNGKTITLNDENLRGVTRMRKADDDTIYLLTDPWSENSAIWKLDIKSFKSIKISDFNSLKDKPYTDTFEW